MSFRCWVGILILVFGCRTGVSDDAEPLYHGPRLSGRTTSETYFNGRGETFSLDRHESDKCLEFV